MAVSDDSLASPRPPRPLTPVVVDGLLAVLVMLAAFLLASSPGRDSGVWMHLATGRALADGQPFGSDPFAYTTGDAYWVNHAWLYDLLAYRLYEALGGTALVSPLVVLKALLAAALAAVMLRTAWRGRPHWVAALCVALAVLAASPYFTLGPAPLSYLLLGLTIWILERPGRAGGDSGGLRALRRYALLPVLFVLWVNFDDWFLLGPLAVALYALGEFVAARRGGDGPAGSRDPRVLAAVAAVGLAACLLNPYGWRAFTLPAALSPSEPAALTDEAVEASAHSPFQLAYFHSALGTSAAGLAYFPLVLAGLASFALNPPGRVGPRALVWAGLLLLSVYRCDAIPFFAVVAGPVTALNLQDWAARRARAVTEVERYAGVGQLVSLVTLLAVAVVSWPGWLLPGAPEPPRWALEADPALEEAARTVARWRAEGRLGAGHGFNLAPELAHYAAWFGPAEKSYWDDRTHLFPRATREDYEEVRRALLKPSDGRAGGTDWRDVLRKANVTHLAVYDPSARRLRIALRRLFGSSGEWQLVYLRGRVLVFAWRDPQRPGPPPVPDLPRIDLAVRPFRPSAAEMAPAEGPSREPRPRRWWDAFREPLPRSSPDRDEALMGQVFFDARQPVLVRRHRALWEGALAAGTVGTPAPPGGLPGIVAGTGLRAALLRVSREQPSAAAQRGQPSPWRELAYRWQAGFLERSRADDGPPGALLFGIRAARRALRDNPDDAVAHLLLGQNYLRMLWQTRERAATPTFPELHRLRAVQAITALKAAALLKPDLAAAHEALASVYGELGATDLALDHVRKLLACTRAAGRRPGESAEGFARRLQAGEQAEAELGKRVRNATNLFETRSFAQDVLARAREAEALGLPGKALDLLLNSPYEAFGREGADLELHLLLTRGQAKEVREWMKPEQEPNLGPQNYHWLQALLAAARGDYVEAGQELERLVPPPAINLPDLGLKDVPVRRAVPLLVGQFVLQKLANHPLVPHTGADAFLGRVVGMVAGARQRARLTILRGLLALERGETAEAVTALRQGLAAWNEAGEGPASLARHYLALIEAARTDSRYPAHRGR